MKPNQASTVGGLVCIAHSQARCDEAPRNHVAAMLLLPALALNLRLRGAAELVSVVCSLSSLCTSTLLKHKTKPIGREPRSPSPVPAMFSKEKTTEVLHFTPGGTETGSDLSSRNRVKLLSSSSIPRMLVE